MKIEVRLIPDIYQDSNLEIKDEIAVLNDILGLEGTAKIEIIEHAVIGPETQKYVAWTGDFWELYKRIKDRIYRRLEAQK